MATRRRGSGQRRRTEWISVFLDDTMELAAATNRIFTELTMQEKGPFTVLRMLINWTAEGVVTSPDVAGLFVIGIRKVTLDRSSDTVLPIGGTLLDPTYANSDALLYMVQQHLEPGFSQVDPSTGAVEYSFRPRASGMWDVKAKRKLDSTNETLVIDTEQVGVGAGGTIRLRAILRILIQPH